MNIVAIGGGDKTLAIKEALSRTGSEHSSVLLVPSACSTPASYDKKVGLLSNYFTGLGVETTVLHEYNKPPTNTELSHKLGRASLIYTIGGNTPFLLRSLREHGTYDAIKAAIESGTVHAGVSAGALLPFEIAHSCVAAKPAETDWDYTLLPGLGVLKGVATAHANTHDPTPAGMRSDTRREALLNNFPDTANRGYAIDNNAALIFSTSSPAIVRAQDDAHASTFERTSSNIQLRPTEIDDLLI